MFEHQSHSYAVQAFALWLSFVPEISILMLIIAAQVERLRRSAWIRKRVAARIASVRLPQDALLYLRNTLL